MTSESPLMLQETDRLLLCGAADHWRNAQLRRMAENLGIRYWQLEPFCPQRALELIDEHAVTVTDWYPWQLAKVLQLPAERRQEYSGGSHRLAWVGGARVPVALLSELVRWWGAILSVHLSSPEWPGCCIAGTDTAINQPGSVGRWMGPAGTKLEVRDSGGNTCEPLQIGVLGIQGLAAEPAAAETELLGYADDSGQIFSLGRRASALTTPYGWFTPYEGEELLESHPAVAAAVLVVVTSEQAQELGYEIPAEAGFFAVVELQQPIDSDAALLGPELEVELMEFCGRGLSAPKCPFGLVFSDSLCRAAGGDIQPPALLEIIANAHL